MSGLDIFFDYFLRSSFITIFVLSWLSIYFIISFTILISRMIGLKQWINDEQNALESLIMGTKIVPVNSILKKCTSGKITKEKLNICISKAQKNSSSGLTWLSIIASTSPFIGLFGTVVSILETFSKLGQSGGSISVIAPAISEALIATGCGIFVAIPAYTFHLLLKRKSYELMHIIHNEADIIVSSSKED